MPQVQLAQQGRLEELVRLALAALRVLLAEQAPLDQLVLWDLVETTVLLAIRGEPVRLAALVRLVLLGGTEVLEATAVQARWGVRERLVVLDATVIQEVPVHPEMMAEQVGWLMSDYVAFPNNVMKYFHFSENIGTCIFYISRKNRIRDMCCRPQFPPSFRPYC